MSLWAGRLLNLQSFRLRKRVTMPHLKCMTHKRRAIVITMPDSTKRVVHRGDTDACNSQWMMWGHLGFVSTHVRSTEESLATPPEGWVYNERCHCGPCGVQRYKNSEEEDKRLAASMGIKL